MTLWVAIEGPDGAGKSEHCEALTERLNAAGVKTARWAHPSPPRTCKTDRSRALWFALQRAIVLENPPVMPNGGRPLVVILDRWVWSNAVAAATSPQTRMQYAIWGTTEGEKAGISRDVKTILLTAPLDVLLARHVARGEAAPGRLAELHQEYQVLARNHGWPVISTDCPGVAASDSIYKIVMGWL